MLEQIQLHRPERAVGTTGGSEAHPILAAGLDAPTADPETPDSTADDHPHSELAWRLRHVKRSVLKDTNDVVSIEDAASEQSIPEAPGSIFGSAFSNAASMAASFFTDPPFTGELNLLTTSAVGSGQQLFSTDFLPRGVAYSALSGEQRDQLVGIVKHYIGRVVDEIAAQEWDKIERAGLDGITFAWGGPVEKGAGHYYAIQGASFIVEYDNTQNDTNHIHSVWRTFDGDWGEDILAQHYAANH
jgi:hypothetical protein